MLDPGKAAMAGLQRQHGVDRAFALRPFKVERHGQRAVGPEEPAAHIGAIALGQMGCGVGAEHHV
jgi:hypothetical protein